MDEEDDRIFFSLGGVAGCGNERGGFDSPALDCEVVGAGEVEGFAFT